MMILNMNVKVVVALNQTLKLLPVQVDLISKVRPRFRSRKKSITTKTPHFFFKIIKKKKFERYLIQIKSITKLFLFNTLY